LYLYTAQTPPAGLATARHGRRGGRGAAARPEARAATCPLSGRAKPQLIPEAASNCLPAQNCLLRIVWQTVCMCRAHISELFAFSDCLLRIVRSELFASSEVFARNCLLGIVCSELFASSEVFARKCLLGIVCSELFAQNCLPLQKCLLGSVCSELFGKLFGKQFACAEQTN